MITDPKIDLPSDIQEKPKRKKAGKGKGKQKSTAVEKGEQGKQVQQEQKEQQIGKEKEQKKYSQQQHHKEKPSRERREEGVKQDKEGTQTTPKTKTEKKMKKAKRAKRQGKQSLESLSYLSLNPNAKPFVPSSLAANQDSSKSKIWGHKPFVYSKMGNEDVTYRQRKHRNINRNNVPQGILPDILQLIEDLKIDQSGLLSIRISRM